MAVLGIRREARNSKGFVIPQRGARATFINLQRFLRVDDMLPPHHQQSLHGETAGIRIFGRACASALKMALHNTRCCHDMFATHSLTLNQDELERLVINLETSTKIRRRHQLYLWTQGVLQSFLPHETLLCAWGTVADVGLRTEICSRALIEDAQAAEFCSGEQSLLMEVARHWASASGAPMTIRSGDETALARRLQRIGIERAACHGMPAFGTTSRKQQMSAGSFFVFLNMPEASLQRCKYLLELLLPQLHVALMHVCNNEETELVPDRLPEPALSDRERQVLQWVRQGKTNHEIGRILSISPLTVKNHVQKILRKLNVSNRAQAAARGSKNDQAKQLARGNALDDEAIASS